MNKPEILVITGPTASGKEATAMAVAETLGGEIISADSMKVYRRMDIGTAKPTAEDRRRVRHHLIDIVDPWEGFSVGRFVELADEAVEEIRRGGGGPPILSGGTPLYIKAFLEGIFDGPSADWEIRKRLREQAKAEGVPALHRRLKEVDPAAAERIHPNDLRRIVRALEVYEKTGRPISGQQREFGRQKKRYRAMLLGIERDRADVYRRIERRVDRMFEEGFEAEVRRLLALKRSLSREARQALGYREIIEWIQGGGDFAQTVELIKRRTRQFAKRQMTWLRKFGDLIWIRADAQTSPEALADEIVRRWRAAVGS